MNVIIAVVVLCLIQVLEITGNPKNSDLEIMQKNIALAEKVLRKTEARNDSTPKKERIIQILTRYIKKHKERIDKMAEWEKLLIVEEQEPTLVGRIIPNTSDQSQINDTIETTQETFQNISTDPNAHIGTGNNVELLTNQSKSIYEYITGIAAKYQQKAKELQTQINNSYPNLFGPNFQNVGKAKARNLQETTHDTPIQEEGLVSEMQIQVLEVTEHS